MKMDKEKDIKQVGGQYEADICDLLSKFSREELIKLKKILRKEFEKDND